MIARRLRDVPHWAWVVVAVVAGLVLLPVLLRVYGLWWAFVSGRGMPDGALMEFLMPRIG